MIRMKDIIVRRRPSRSAMAQAEADVEFEAAEPVEFDYEAELAANDPVDIEEWQASKDDQPRTDTASDTDDEPEIDAALLASAARAAAPSGAEPAGPRKNIWDLAEDDDDDDAPEAAPEPEAKPEDAALTARPKAVAQGADSRAKTRLLGFHTDEEDKNIFAGAMARKPVAAARYPVGWVVVIDGPGRGASFTLSQGLSTIGRAADQTIALDFGDESISRDNHASIAYDEEDNAVYIGHGGKSNIVRLNGHPLLSTEVMQNGDLLKIGRTTMRFVAFCGPEFAWTEDEDQGGEDAELG